MFELRSLCLQRRYFTNRAIPSLWASSLAVVGHWPTRSEGAEAASRVQTSECDGRAARDSSRETALVYPSRARAYRALRGKGGKGDCRKGGKLERYLCAESESSAHGQSSENVRHLCSEALSKYGWAEKGKPC